MSEDKTKEIIKIIIDSVRYCHENEIIHRDIKPDNIMFGSKNKEIWSIKLVDF